MRIRSSEIYQAVEGLIEIRDSLVVDLEFLDRDSFMPLFVVLMSGIKLNDALKKNVFGRAHFLVATAMIQLQ